MGMGPLLEAEFETTAGTKTLREIIGGDRPTDRPTVFMSYPMDFTPVCTKQLCSYRDDWDTLGSLHCHWWGINRFAVEKHRKFKSQHEFPFDLISDPKSRILGALGLKSLLWTSRGFAIVTPEGELVASSSVFPAFYRKSDEVKAFLEPYLEG